MTDSSRGIKIALKPAAEEIDRSKRLANIGALASVIAHELRNTLGVMASAAYNIRQKFEKDAPIDSHIVCIERKIAESRRIINNLLFYSRIRAPQYKKIKIYDMLRECVADLKIRFSDYKVAVKIFCDGPEGCRIDADRTQIREFFNNVLNNACEAFPKRKGKITINAGFDSKAACFKVDIRDNGIGIEPENIDRVFEPFFSTKSKGTGLGLAICREIIRLHNGKMDIENKPGKGTVVTAFWPSERMLKGEERI